MNKGKTLMTGAVIFYVREHAGGLRQEPRNICQAEFKLDDQCGNHHHGPIQSHRHHVLPAD